MKSKEQSDREKEREKQFRRNNVFSVGDRVEYHPTNGYGDNCLDGKRGTVVFVDWTSCGITVQFDDPIDGFTELRGDTVINNCRHCAVENLKSVRRRRKKKQNADVEKETVEEQMPPEHKPPELSFAEKQTATIIRLCMDYCKWRATNDKVCNQTDDEIVRSQAKYVLRGICSTCPVHTLLGLDKDGAP